LRFLTKSQNHDWEGEIGAPGFKEALLAYGRAEGVIKARRGLPKDEDELKELAAQAIESGDTEFSLEDAEGERGSTDVRVFAGLYWMCDWGGISGPFTSLEEAAEDVLAMAVGQDCPGFYSAASGAVPDDFIAARSAKLVKVGKTFVINDTVYRRTKTGLVPQ
jgi:hypothetical protein